MTPRKSYSRYFIILQEEQKGYGMDADKAPSGYAKLEVKNNRSKISYYVQNLKKDRGPYYMILITDKQNPRSLINLGKLNIDDNGRADVNFDYDMNSIGNTNIAMDKIVGAAVVYMNGKITPIMIGFSTTDVPKDWTTYPISKGTTQPTTGTGSGATGGGTGTGTTTKPSTGTGTGTGAGTGTTGGMGTGGTGVGTGTGAGTTGGMGTGGIGTGTTGTGAGITGGMGAGTTGGTGTTTKPSTGTGAGAGTGTTGTGVGTGTGAGTTGGMGTGGIGTGTTGTGAGITGGMGAGTTGGTGTTTKPSTGTGTGAGTGTTGTGVGTGAGAGTTGGMGTGVFGTGTTGTGGTGVGTGATGGTGTTTKPSTGTGAGAGTGTTGTGVGTGTGAGTTGGMGTGGFGTGNTGAGATGIGGAGTTTGGTTGTGNMGTQPSTGTTNGFVDEFEDYYEDVNIINMTPTGGGSTPTRNRDIFDLYEEEIENSKLDRHKHKKCKHHEEEDCHCKHHNKHHGDEDECPEYLMHHMYDDDDYKNDNHCSPCMDNKKHDVKYNNYENNKNEMYKDDMHKYNWPLGNTGEFFKNVVKGFEKLGENENIKNCLWYKVSVNKLEDMYCIYDYNKYTVVFYPMICYYPYISKKKNFVIGYKCDEEGNLKYIIYGIPGTKALEDQPYGGKTGFVTWMPSKNEKDMGHWLMYYDFKTNNVVIPIKR